MIAADASVFKAYFAGETMPDTDLLHQSLMTMRVAIAPVVVTELLSAPSAGALREHLEKIDTLALLPGYWERAGHTRRELLRRGFTSSLSQALVAQCCLDHRVSLLTRDPVFGHFSACCGLSLVN